MEAIAIGSKVFGAIQQMQMAKAQQQMYNLQAKQAEMQARAGMLRTRSETLNHKRQGIQVLKKIAQNLSTINARAAAGSVDPFSGSVANLAIYNLGKGVTDFFTSKENQELMQLQGQIIEAGGAIQSAQYVAAGNMARRQGYINAVATLGEGAYMANQTGGFSFTNPKPAPSVGNSSYTMYEPR